jgi:hypothetical protein
MFLGLSLITINAIAAEKVNTADIYAKCGVEVDTDYDMQANVYHIGCNKSLDIQLGKIVSQYSSDADKKQAVKEFMQENKEIYKNAFQAEVHMALAGVKKYPAVVLNNKYIVYGTSEIKTAKDQLFRLQG